MPESASRRAAALLFLAALAINTAAHVAAPAALRVPPSTDYLNEYRTTAHNLEAGKGLISRTGLPATHFPPGYMVILAVLYRLAGTLGLDEMGVVRGFEILCAAVTVLLVHRLALRLWRPLPALLVAIVWMTYLPAIWTTHQLASEPPFLVAWLGALLLVLRGLPEHARGAWWMFAAGVAAGCAALIRSLAAAVAIVLAVLLVWGLRGRTLRTRTVLAAALLAGNLLTVLPWEAFAWMKLGRIIPLSTSGPATVLNGLAFAAPGFGEAGPPPPPRIAELMDALMARREEFLAPGRTLTVMREELGARPAAAAQLFAWKAARSWYATDGRRFEAPMMLMQGTYLALFAASGVIALRRGGARRRVALSAGLLVAYFWGVTTMVFSIARYMLPAMPLMFLLFPHLLPARLRSAGLSRD